MATPEIPKNSPASTPAKAPDDTLLKNFRATLEARWGEFDAAAIQEAGLFSGMRDADKKYQQAKKAFDEAKKMLASIQNDTELKVNTQVLETVESTLKALTDHLKEIKPEEKNKAINIILAKTTADLSQFKADITGKEEDKKQAEVAIAAEKAIPRTAVVAASTAGGFSLMSSADAADGLSSAVSEGAQDLGKEVAAIKKNPMKKIAEFLGFTDSSIASDIKAALAEKKAGGFDGFFASIKLWFYGLMAKFTGADLSASLTPEEMKLAGIKGKVGGEAAPQTGKENGNEEEKKKMENKYKATTFILGELASKENVDITKIYGLDSVKTLKYSELIAFSEKNNVSGLRSKLGVGKDVSDSALIEFMKLMTSKDHTLYFLLAGSYEKKGDKKLVDATTFDILSHVGSDIKILGSIKSIDITNYKESSEKMAKNMFTIGDNGEISGELVAKSEELGISKNLLGVLFGPRVTPFKDKNSITTLLQDPSLSKEDKEMLQKLGAFGEGFIETLKTDTRINLGIGDEVTKMHTAGKIQLGDILKSYIMTKGQTNIDNMDTLQKVGAYTSFLMITGSTTEGSGALSGKIFNLKNVVDFANGNSIFDVIPQDVQKLLKSMFDIDVILKKIKEMGIDMSDYMTAFAKQSPAFATLLILTVLFLPVFAQRTSLSRIFTGR